MKIEIIHGFFENRLDFNQKHAVSKMHQPFDKHGTAVILTGVAGGGDFCRVVSSHRQA